LPCRGNSRRRSSASANSSGGRWTRGRRSSPGGARRRSSSSPRGTSAGSPARYRTSRRSCWRRPTWRRSGCAGGTTRRGRWNCDPVTGGFLLDTNVLSEARKPDGNPHVRAWLATVRGDELYLSVLVLGEIRQGVERLRRRDPRQAGVYEAWLATLRRDYAD